MAQIVEPPTPRAAGLSEDPASPAPPLGSLERRAVWADRVALWLVQLAKLRRRRLSRPRGDDYDRFYEQFFDEKDAEAYERDQRMTLRRETINAALARHRPPPATLLDVGCGLGDVLGGVAPGYRLFGFDYAAANARIAARRLRGRAGVCRASIYEMPWPDGCFDVALCLEVLEHIEDDGRAVREVARVLKPGGLLIAAVPYTYYWPQYLELMGHFRHYTRRSFAALVDGNGLRTETYLPNYPNFHQAYTERYAWTRFQAMTAGRLLGRRTLYDFKWPWRRETALERVAQRLAPLRRRDEALDYAAEPTSTFLLARKPAVPEGGEHAR